jgi:RNA polymerase sigma-70 factor (TIGR02960 family)
MTRPGPAPPEGAPEQLVAAAKGGDESAFAALVEPHRRELHVHCYRMLGSFEAAEDQVQETFMRAWRGRDRFEGGGLFRAWLYRIATNACLDELRRSARRAPALHSFGDVPWLQPYPDRLLDEVAPREAEPDAVVVSRETIELTFIAVIQTLPPRQRAVLILRDVLEWSARETAALLEMSVAAANSALQRARQTVGELRPGERLERSAEDLTEAERRLLQGFIDTHERGDAAAAAAMVADDIRITMPPHPFLFEGREAMASLLERAFGPESPGDWLLVPTRANRQPTAASYLRQPGDSEYRAFKFDVLRVEGGLIAEVTTFDETLFDAFGLPPTWPAERRS